MIALTATAHCLRCDWSAAGSMAEVDKQAERHTKTGHPTATLAAPAHDGRHGDGGDGAMHRRSGVPGQVQARAASPLP
jgi:hypothetical protein